MPRFARRVASTVPWNAVLTIISPRAGKRGQGPERAAHRLCHRGRQRHPWQGIEQDADLVGDPRVAERQRVYPQWVPKVRVLTFALLLRRSSGDSGRAAPRDVPCHALVRVARFLEARSRYDMCSLLLAICGTSGSVTAPGPPKVRRDRPPRAVRDTVVRGVLAA